MANGHQERRRTCFECPYAYSRDDTGAWGCHLFGEECAGNKQFDVRGVRGEMYGGC